MKPDNQRVVRSAVITGAGAGLGRELALTLARKGYQVFGTALNPEEIADLQENSGGRVKLTVCNITDEAAVTRFQNTVSSALLGGGLNLLVSNVGILTPGPMELLPLAAIRHEFEVNVFGSLQIIHAFLPLLRQARGRVVQISSLVARFPVPFIGPLSASKAALEAFADVYRTELLPFGVEFTTVLPGNMKTTTPARVKADVARLADSMTPEQRSLYAESFGSFAASLNSAQHGGMEATEAAAIIVEIAERQPAPTHVAVGPEAEKLLRAVHERTDAELDLARLQYIGLKPGKPF